VPKIAFLPIFMLWLGLYDVSKIFDGGVQRDLPVIAGTMAAAEDVDRISYGRRRSLGARERQLLREIILPAGIAADLDRTAGCAGRFR